MKATELYSIGIKAYNGDVSARAVWFSMLAPLAIQAATPYRVLPSLVLAKAAIESGYATDQYEIDFYEPEYCIKMERKAQNHNNIIGMNAFLANMQYLPEFPKPRWCDYELTFLDYAPHYQGKNLVLLPAEPWKHFETIEDCLEDWCANMRYQAKASGRTWGMTIEEQLKAIESYTPEGSPAETPGMRYEWQDYILYLYKDFGLDAYDREAYGMGETLTQAKLDEHIKNAYLFAHDNCTYGPTNTSYPPGANGVIDCVGLVYRAFYTLGLFPCAMDIDQIGKLCTSNGMAESADINDVWRRHGVACFQDKNNVGTNHVNHVYYSLGGSGLENISKYDLGSNQRIQSAQPFRCVPVNEWKDTKSFYRFYYLPEGQPEAVTPFLSDYAKYARITKKTTVYAGAGENYKKQGTLQTLDNVLSLGVVTGTDGKLWRAVYTVPKMQFGYVDANAVDTKSFTPYNGKITGTDGTLALRTGADLNAAKIADIPDGETVKVDGSARSNDGVDWYHVKWRGKRGFSAACHIAKVK